MAASVTIDAFSHEVLANPAPETKRVPNTESIDTASGYPRVVKWGSYRRTGTYHFSLNSTALSSFQSMIAASNDLADTVAVTDHQGNSFTAKITDFNEVAYNPTNTLVTVAVEEVPTP